MAPALFFGLKIDHLSHYRKFTRVNKKWSRVERSSDKFGADFVVPQEMVCTIETRKYCIQ